jgi:acyl carrier protein
MDRTAIVSSINDALSEVLNRDASGLDENVRLFEDMHLDSTSVLELLMALEDKLGIEVDPESLEMDNFKTLGTLTDYVSTALGVPR